MPESNDHYASWQKAEAALERVRALHAKSTHNPRYCMECGEDWPCYTIEVIEKDGGG